MIARRPGAEVPAENQRLILEFRNLFFTTSEGKRVWARILARLGWGVSDSPESVQIEGAAISDEVRSAFRALAWELYEWAGVNHEANEMAMHEALMKLPPFFMAEERTRKENTE